MVLVGLGGVVGVCLIEGVWFGVGCKLVCKLWFCVVGDFGDSNKLGVCYLMRVWMMREMIKGCSNWCLLWNIWSGLMLGWGSKDIFGSMFGLIGCG